MRFSQYKTENVIHYIRKCMQRFTNLDQTMDNKLLFARITWKFTFSDKSFSWSEFTLFTLHHIWTITST